MRKAFRILNLFLMVAVLPMACNERRSDEAQGKEIEIAGDEPDETSIKNEQQIDDYNPGDTVINVKQEELPVYLRDHTQVLVSAYLDIEEALVNDNPEVAKEKAQQIIDLIKRHEQENMELEPQVKEFYTKAAHVIRQSARNILDAQEMWEIKSAFSAMAPAAYKLAKVADISGLSLYYQFCPQSFNKRGAYWLSRSKEIKNPYAGEGKEDCGKTVATL